jgi:hypothetical protein
MERHEAEVQKLKTYYEEHKPLFEKLQRRQSSWNHFLELDVSRVFFQTGLILPSKVTRCAIFIAYFHS